MADAHDAKKPAGGAPKGPPKAPPAAPSGNKFTELILLALLALILLPVIGVLTPTLLGSPVADFFSAIFSGIKVIATIISMLALIVAIYAYMRVTELTEEETRKLGLVLNWNTERKQKNERWERVEAHMTSLSQSDWKIAILEADNILDEIVERMGYQGESLGERLKKIEASDFPYLDDAWTAHKTRNAIAHKGTNFDITRGEAEQTINIYYRVFKELGYL